MKDPAFLFYAKDFYEGTRMMLPKERACYVDLMIYQHQHGVVPNDIERLMMYCGGIDESTIKSTLESKFMLTDNGWINMKLQTVIDERREFSKKQSANGLVGQFFKKAKSTLSAKDYKELKNYVYNVYTKEALIQALQKEEATHEGLLKALLKHLEDEDVDVDEDVIIDKKKRKEQFEKFWNLYDHKKDKKTSLDIWMKLTDEEIDMIRKTVRTYLSETQDKKFRKHPSTYLNQKTWLDYTDQDGKLNEDIFDDTAGDLENGWRFVPMSEAYEIVRDLSFTSMHEAELRGEADEYVRKVMNARVQYEVHGNAWKTRK